MSAKTIVLKKNGHWYVVNSRAGDEKEILLALIEYSEQKQYDIAMTDVDKLAKELGWQVETFIPGLGAA